MNSVPRTIFRAGCLLVSDIRSNSTLAAWCPSSCAGCRTTVRPGGIISASSKSSNETSGKSVNIFFFAALSARKTRIVQTQLRVKIASTRLGPDRNGERSSGVRSLSC